MPLTAATRDSEDSRLCQHCAVGQKVVDVDENEGEYGLANEAEKPSTPKQPTEVDRLKTQQKQETILTKARQARELAAAKQRELQKKAREDQRKITAGDKPGSITK